MFQGFAEDLMMVIGNLMQWKFRMPSVLKKMLRNMTEKNNPRHLELKYALGKGRWRSQNLCQHPPIPATALGYSEGGDDRVRI